MISKTISEDTPALLTYPEAADFMRISASSLRQRVSAGKIPSTCIVRFGGNKSSVRFRRRELEKWLLGEEN